VVPFLNGMAHLAVLSKRFGESAVLGGVVVIVTQLNDEGDIVQLRPQASLTSTLGETASAQRVKALQ
jgi:2-dehydropantoate 2-reductase